MRTEEFNPRTPEEKRMWRHMLSHSRFRYSDVMKGADVSRYFIDIFSAKLRRLGLIKPCGREGQDQYFTVMDEKAAEKFAAGQKGRKEGLMWTAMRSLMSFTPQEVILVVGQDQSEVAEEDARKYCALLLKADYLAVVQKARPGVHPARYRLIRDTGPLPPVKRTLEVLVDGNEERAVYAAGARI